MSSILHSAAQAAAFVVVISCLQAVSNHASGQTRAAAVTVTPAPARTITFSENTGVIDNPERGFSAPVDLLDEGGLGQIRRERNITLIRAQGRLDEYRSSDLPDDVLEKIDARLLEARAAGLKVILRFAYNEGPYPNSAPDASLDWIKRHIAQLKPYLQKHSDVIAWMEAGFIGAWGEWHSSTHGLDHDIDAKRQVADALFDALPSSRGIQLRYPADIAALYGATFTRREAHTGNKKSRTGHHNDCFLASDEDGGTYGRYGRSVAQDKSLVADYGHFTPVGGETCKVNSPRTDCAAAVAEMERVRFSELNIGYHPGVIDGWRSGGCFDTIQSRLGYRLQLESMTVPGALVRGDEARFTITLKNTGFAAPVLKRPLYMVLDGPERRVFPLPYDARAWLPRSSYKIDIIAEIPADLPLGRYALSLWLPDDAQPLQQDVRFAIQLANSGVWQADTGYNRLLDGIEVVAPPVRQTVGSPAATQPVRSR
jgi:hypothetical protein